MNSTSFGGLGPGPLGDWAWPGSPSVRVATHAPAMPRYFAVTIMDFVPGFIAFAPSYPGSVALPDGKYLQRGCGNAKAHLAERMAPPPATVSVRFACASITVSFCA